MSGKDNCFKQIETKQCSECGCDFVTTDKNENLCMSCKIIKEMKLPEDTIVNQNVLNIYLSKQYDLVKGVDPIYLSVAEGVLLFKNSKRNVEKIYSRIKLFGRKSNDKIEKYVKVCLTDYGYRASYDAMVFVRVNAHLDFLAFGVSLSDRIYKKLEKEDTLFKKNYILSLAINWYFKNVSK